MAHANENLLRDAYAEFEHGDINTLKSRFFAKDIRWHYPGTSPLGGDYDGVDQVAGWLLRTFEACWGSITVEVHDVVANDEHAVALTTVRAEREGGAFRTTLCRSSTSRTARPPRYGPIPGTSMPRMCSGPKSHNGWRDLGGHCDYCR